MNSKEMKSIGADPSSLAASPLSFAQCKCTQTESVTHSQTEVEEEEKRKKLELKGKWTA